jgi:hypothetical protein
MFGYILGPRLFGNPKGPLARKQAFFPIPFGDIKFIQTTTIAQQPIQGIGPLLLQSKMLSLWLVNIPPS